MCVPGGVSSTGSIRWRAVRKVASVVTNALRSEMRSTLAQLTFGPGTCHFQDETTLSRAALHLATGTRARASAPATMIAS